MKPALRRLFLFVADNLFSLFIVAPLTVAYWRGTWVLLDIHLHSNRPDISAWVCVVIGNIGLVVLAWIQDYLTVWISRENKIQWFLCVGIYNYIAGFFSVCHWRGIWVGLDVYTSRSYQSHMIGIIVCK